MVDFVMEVEERLGMAIREEEFADLYTWGDLYRLLCHKLQPQGGTACLNARVFMRLRRGLREVGVDTRGLRPGVEVGALIADRGRRRKWAALSEHMGLHLPDLVRPQWLRTLGSWAPLIVLAVAACVGLGIGRAYSSGAGWGAFVASLVAGGLLGALVEWATRCLAGHFTPPNLTVGDLVRCTVGMNAGSLLGERAALGHEDVWSVVHAAAVKELGLPPEVVVPDALIGDMVDWHWPKEVAAPYYGSVRPRRLWSRDTGERPWEPSPSVAFPNIVMDLERELGTHMTGRDLRPVETIWDLHQLCLAKTDVSREGLGPCAGREVFNRLRRVLIEELGVPRAQVTPSLDLSTLGLRPRRLWSAFRKQTGLVLPALGPYPQAQTDAEAWGCLFGVPIGLLGTLTVVAGASHWLTLSVTAVPLGLAVAVAVGVYRGWLALARRWPSAVPVHCRTLGALARETVRLNHDALLPGPEGAAARKAEETWELVREVIARRCPWAEPDDIRGRTSLRALTLRYPAA